MQKTPLVSAVIITYNQEKYIEQTIDCALAQKVDFDYEIVIGEDCSTDSTLDICLNYQEKYPNIIRVITSDKNVGILDNYYRTVKAARGKYIAGCGGDDYWHNPMKIQKQVKFLEENPEYGMVHSDADFLLAKSGVLEKNYYASQRHFHDNNSKDILALLLGGNYLITACTVVYRKVFFNQYFKIDMLNRHGFQMEDTPLWAEIIVNSKIHYMTESFTTRRILEESITQSKDRLKTLKFWISNTEMCLYLCDKYGLPEYIKKWHEQNWRRKSLQLAFIEKRRDLAEQVKQKFPKFSIKDWFWYQGTKNPLMRQVVLLIQSLQKRGD
jgi:glycosyltransferase involved in cell wall biosynthesis